MRKTETNINTLFSLIQNTTTFTHVRSCYELHTLIVRVFSGRSNESFNLYPYRLEHDGVVTHLGFGKRGWFMTTRP